jgi:glyoxylase-like metal-dependent hydrolase (beta-lactamase superfamily II)
MKVHAQPRPLTAPIPGGTREATVRVEPIQAGSFTASSTFAAGPVAGLRARMGAGGGAHEVPVPTYLIEHPTFGRLLIDTGFHPSITAKPSANLGHVISRRTEPKLAPGGDLAAQLRERGIDAKSIELVVMTHLHFDRASAMTEFEGATFIVSLAEWEGLLELSQPAHHEYRTEHFDYAFDYRTVDYDGESISSYSTFARTFDLFGDGSVRLAFTPGHSPGHQAVICRLRDHDLVIAGDAIESLGELDGSGGEAKPFDPHTHRRSIQELRLFHRNYPQAVILPGHDSEVWAASGRIYE